MKLAEASVDPGVNLEGIEVSRTEEVPSLLKAVKAQGIEKPTHDCSALLKGWNTRPRQDTLRLGIPSADPP